MVGRVRFGGSPCQLQRMSATFLVMCGIAMRCAGLSRLCRPTLAGVDRESSIALFHQRRLHMKTHAIPAHVR